MTTQTSQSSPFGTHRAVDPPGVLPYTAFQLDPSLPIQPSEMLMDVERLNVDSASFVQLRQAAHDDPERLAQEVMRIVTKRGKMHNPVTGSGGVLVGKVKELGSDRRDSLAVGDRIVSLVSLTTTPLHLENTGRADFDTHQIEVKGHAILFEKSHYARLPADLPESVVLPVLDVCGAPAQTARLVKEGNTVLILGAGGRSGMLCTAVALENCGDQGRVLALASARPGTRALSRLGAFADPRLQIIVADATDALAVYREVAAHTGGRMADVTINCVNVAHSEMSAILATRSRGLVYFFNMATSFTAAALGAESIGHDVDMMIGNGYTEGHAEYALNVVRRHPVLLQLLG